jgi:hypothetical protein
VLSSQRVELNQALYDTAKAKDRQKDDQVNPLVQNGKKLIPSVNRVFSTTREIYVFFQAYKQPQPAAAPSTTPATTPTGKAPIPTPISADTKPTPQPLFAFVTLYQGDNKVYDTPPTAIVPNPSSRLGTMPLTFSLGVNGLPPGEYNCQVTILDPATGKANFWRAPILLVP